MFWKLRDKFQVIIRYFYVIVNSVIRFFGYSRCKYDEYCCPKCGSILKLYKHGKFRCDKVYIGGEQTRGSSLFGIKGNIPISKISKPHRLIPRFLAGCRSPQQAKGEPLKVREFNVVRVRVC